jgi:hypothetical protein
MGDFTKETSATNEQDLVSVLTQAQIQLNRKNRRKGPDFWLRALTVLTVAGWLLLFASFVLFDLARPETETLFHHIMGVLPQKGWNERLRNAVFYLVIGCQGVSMIGVWVNGRRMRRRSDKYRWSIMGLGITSSLIALLIMFFNK